MAPTKTKQHGGDDSKKRKRTPATAKSGGDGGGEKPSFIIKKSKFTAAKEDNKNKGLGLKKKVPFKAASFGKPKFEKSDNVQIGDKTKKELRIQSKELAEARKKRRKPHYTLEQELALLWEKMRQRNISNENRSKLVSEALRKMKGKTHEIAGSHVSSRVLQTCVKYCSEEERNAVYADLRPHLLTLACNVYAVHLVTKLLDHASKSKSKSKSKEQLAEFISSLHGHAASLLRHMVGSVVVEHAYQLGNATQKQSLLMELYSTELQLFKDLVSIKENRLVDIISKLQLQKGSVLRHMASVINPILEKGIVDHSILHKALEEYLTIADQFSAADVLQQLSGGLLIRMIHTKEGSRIGMWCVKHGSAKERKKIIKAMKGHVGKIAHDRFGNLVLVCLLSIVDDTKLATKIIIQELKANLKKLVMDKNGRRPFLQLLHPNCPRYFSPEDLSSLDSSIPSLHNKADLKTSSDISEQTNPLEIEADEEDKSDTDVLSNKESTSLDVSQLSTEGGKKDPTLRRRELLVDSGLAESLIDVCCENAEELLKSNQGREVVYEVATGGSGGILHPNLDEKLQLLHEAIALLVALPKSEIQDEKHEHLLQNFHSRRTIRKLILDCPSFAINLWNEAFKGRCESWAQGHSSKVVWAFLESSDPKVFGLVKTELQPLVDSGVLTKTKKPT